MKATASKRIFMTVVMLVTEFFQLLITSLDSVKDKQNFIRVRERKREREKDRKRSKINEKRNETSERYTMHGIMDGIH